MSSHQLPSPKFYLQTMPECWLVPTPSALAGPYLRVVWLPSWLSGPLLSSTTVWVSSEQVSGMFFPGPQTLVWCVQGVLSTPCSLKEGVTGYPAGTQEVQRGGNTAGRGWKWETDRSRKDRITLSLALVGNGYL